MFPGAFPSDSVDSPICLRFRWVTEYLIAEDVQPEWHVGHYHCRSGSRFTAATPRPRSTREADRMLHATYSRHLTAVP